MLDLTTKVMVLYILKKVSKTNITIITNLNSKISKTKKKYELFSGYV